MGPGDSSTRTGLASMASRVSTTSARIPNSPQRRAIAAAGPAVSFVLGGIALALYAVSGVGVFMLLGWINLALGAFNMVPALPMDGGRIFRALLSKRYRFARATEISVKVSKGFAIAFAVAGLALQHVYLVVLAGVLWFMGNQERRAASHAGYQDDAEVIPRDRGNADPGSPFGIPQAGAFVVRAE